MKANEFDRDQWVYDLVVTGTLTERQAVCYVRFSQGWNVPRIAGDLGIDRVTVRAHLHNAIAQANQDMDTYLLMFGPVEFHRNRDEYPQVRDALLEAVEPEGGVRPLTLSRNRQRC